MNHCRCLWFSLTVMLVVESACTNLKDAKLFIKNAFKDPSVVGAVRPSSKSVGEELMRYVLKSQQENPGKPLRILEVGAGTGPVSEVIISHARACDHVDLIEIFPDFCKVLHEKFDTYQNVSIQCLSILDWQPAEPYDFIISTLPFNSFEYDLMNGIVNHFELLIKSGGVISYVAYVGISGLIAHFAWGHKKTEQVKKIKRIKQWQESHLKSKKTILKNVPPINIYHLQF